MTNIAKPRSSILALTRCGYFTTIAVLLIVFFSEKPPHHTFSQTQFAKNEACGSASSTCAITVTSTGTGHFGIITWQTDSTTTLSSVSGGGTWTVPAGCTFTNGLSVGCAYNLTLGSGVTTVTLTWTNASPGSPTSAWFYEESFTGSSVSLDNGSSGGLGTVNNTSSSTTQPGVALTLACSNCAIFQAEVEGGGQPNSINGSYTLDSGVAFRGTAHILNTASGTAPTWTLSASATNLGGAIAIKETSAVTVIPRRHGGVW
jgi:hypothetical protein